MVACLCALTNAADARTHKKKKRVAHIKLHAPVKGQSVGAPWEGRLQHATELPAGEGYFIRRPWRAYGTRTTVELVELVISQIREQFPDMHVLAIGDISAEHGGAITEHHSHQAGRDADIGLIYTEQPAHYPEAFVTATEDNLDPAATFALISDFAATANRDGGVQVMFLDYDVQGIVYAWAKDHDVDDAVLEKLFQYPRRDATDALVRHEPNHANHLHVRFKCPRGDSACQ